MTGRPFCFAESYRLVTKAAMTFKIEEVKEVADGRAVERHVGADEVQRERIGEVVAAALGNRRQIPVALDELENRDVIRIAMRNMSRTEIRTYHKKYDPGAVPEEIERLDVSGIVIATPFVKRDEDHRILRIRRRLHSVDNFLAEPLEQVELRRGWMAVH
jgi:uncharacterized DUF497 family protein